MSSKIDLRKLSPTARLDLESRCWLAVSEGRALADVAAEHGLQYHQLVHLLGRVRRRVLAVVEHHAREYLADQVLHLDRLRSEATAEWYRSKEPLEQLGERSGAKGVETSYSLKGQNGNPSYLAEARAAMADLREVLGLVDRLKDAESRPLESAHLAGLREPTSSVGPDGGSIP